MGRDDLAAIVGVTARTLQRLENEGVVGLPLLRRVCRALGLEIGAVLCKDPLALRNHLRSCGLGPALPPPLVGRATQLAELAALLVTPSNQARVLVLEGPVGVGKTSLAQHLAQATSDHFDDGVVWLRADFDDVRQVELAIARALGFAAFVERHGEASGRDGNQVFASHFWSGRRLLLLDDVVAADQVRAFSANDARATIVVTTRFAHVAEEIASDRVSVEPLSDGATAELLAVGLDRSVLEQDRASLARLLELIGGIPGAAAIAQAALRRERLTTLASWVARESRAGDAPADRFRQMLASSYTGLRRQLSPAAWELFAVLGIFGCDPVPLPWAAAAAAGSLETIQGAASELLDCGVAHLQPGPDDDPTPRLRLAACPAAAARSLLGERVTATRARVVAHVGSELGAQRSQSPHALSAYCRRHRALLRGLQVDLGDDPELASALADAR